VIEILNPHLDLADDIEMMTGMIGIKTDGAVAVTVLGIAVAVATGLAETEIAEVLIVMKAAVAPDMTDEVGDESLLLVET